MLNEEIDSLLRRQPEDKAGWAKAFQELARVSGYEDDWDGEGSDKATFEAREVARDYLAWLHSEGYMPPEQVYLTFGAGIHFDWRIELFHIEDSIQEDGSILRCWFCRGDEEAKSEVITFPRLAGA